MAVPVRSLGIPPLGILGGQDADPSPPTKRVGVISSQACVPVAGTGLAAGGNEIRTSGTDGRGSIFLDSERIQELLNKQAFVFTARGRWGRDDQKQGA